MQQPLAQPLRVAYQQALRLALGLEREQGKGDIRVFVVDHRPDHPSRKLHRLVADLLARLIKLLRHLRRRGGVEQGQSREGQAGARVGLAAVVPAQFLQALFDLFGDLVLHLLGGGAGPGGNDGHHLDRERRVFRPPQLEERHEPGQRDQADQEQGDGALAHGERRQIETTFAHGRTPSTAATAASPATRTCWPSRSRCTPSAIIRSPCLN
ncbi:hypothetical protein D3C85_902020 [compost metagenome]